MNNFIKGFFNINYDVPLKSKPDKIDYDTMLVMGPTIGSITRTLGYFPISNVKFGLKEYDIHQYDDENLCFDLLLNDGCKSFVKVNNVFYESAHKKEIDVIYEVFSMGLDRKIWKFRFKTFFVYDTWNNCFDDEIIELSNEYVNGFISAMKFKSMTLYNHLEVDSLYDTDNIQKRHFSGSVKTYGDVNSYGLFSLISSLPEDDTLESGMISESVCSESSLDKYIENNSLIVDVIRKEKINVSIRGE